MTLVSPSRTLESVAAVGATTLHVVWEDGSAATIDVAPVIARHRDFAFLNGNPGLFATAAPSAPRRRAVSWIDPAGTEQRLHVDALWRLQNGYPPPIAESL
jgi:hypothetical protein